MRTVLLGFCLFALVCQSYGAELRIPTEVGQRHKFPDQLIIKMLERSDKYQPRYPYGDIDSLPMSTRLNDVRNGQLDIFFALTTPQYERDFIPIRIPIYRGLLGWRLAVVKKENLQLFRGVETLGDLQNISAGQGTHWADTAILEANNIPVVKELKYSNLFRMLEADRFDFFPRGLNEPWTEIKREAHLDLAVDPYIVLQYKVPFYFFVNRNNPGLAMHLESILEDMIADGSFLKLFYATEEIKMAFSKANLQQRTIIELENPFLPTETPVHRKELWVTREEISRRSANKVM